MRVLAVLLVRFLCFADAAGPEFKYKALYDGYAAAIPKVANDNKKFYDAFSSMAKNEENGVKTLRDEYDRPVLHYIVHEAGKGKHSPKENSQCECNYKGVTIDGEQFDSSFDQGEPTKFAPNQVIRGWREAMQQMGEGDMWEMIIPSDNAYGDRGAGRDIPGGATLVFIMRLEKILGKKGPRPEL